MSLELNFIQIIVIIVFVLIIALFITYLNLKKNKTKKTNKEQNIWEKIDQLNINKKDLENKKKEISFKYTAKTISEDEYSKEIDYLNKKIKEIDNEINENISYLENLQSKTNDPKDNIRFENITLKSDLNEIKIENKNLKSKVNELKEFIKQISKNEDISSSQKDSAKKKYYLEIINKYKDLINENERKTISEIKEMINPNDLTIKSIVSNHSPIAYDFDKDYINTLKKVYNFLKTEIDIIKSETKVLFWIDFSKIIKNKIADSHDISVFFCSIMQALEDKNSKVKVLLLEEDIVHTVTITKYKQTYYLFDLTQKVPFDTFKNTDYNQLINDFRYNNKKIVKELYSYNQYDYQDNN